MNIVIIDNNTELYLWKLLRDLKSSYHKKNNYMWWWMCSLILLWLSFFNIYIYKIIMLYTLNLYNVTCQSHFNKAGRNIFYIIIALDRTERLHVHFHFHALEKEMATHSSVVAWRIPGTGEPGGLPSMGSHWVGHDWSNLAAAALDRYG